MRRKTCCVWVSVAGWSADSSCCSWATLTCRSCRSADSRPTYAVNLLLCCSNESFKAGTRDVSSWFTFACTDHTLRCPAFVSSPFPTWQDTTLHLVSSGSVKQVLHFSTVTALVCLHWHYIQPVVWNQFKFIDSYPMDNTWWWSYTEMSRHMLWTRGMESGVPENLGFGLESHKNEDSLSVLWTVKQHINKQLNKMAYHSTETLIQNHNDHITTITLILVHAATNAAAIRLVLQNILATQPTDWTGLTAALTELHSDHATAHWGCPCRHSVIWHRHQHYSRQMTPKLIQL